MGLASRCSQEIDVATAFGWTVGERRFDWERLRSNVAAEVSRLEAAYTNGLLQAGVSVLYDRATLEDRGVVRLAGSGEAIRPRSILIATGARPSTAEQLPGADRASAPDASFAWPFHPPPLLVRGPDKPALKL